MKSSHNLSENFDSYPDLILWLDRSGILLDQKGGSEPAFEKYIKFKVGSNILGQFSDPFLSELQHHINLALETRTNQTWIHYHGGEFLTQYFEWRIQVKHDDTVLAIVRDITEKTWSENTLRLSGEWFKNLVQDVQVGVILYGPHAEILLANLTAQKMLESAESDLLGTTNLPTNLDVINRDGSPFSMADFPVQAAIHRKSAVENVVIGVSSKLEPDAHTWLLLNVQPRTDSEMNVEYVTATLIDITDFRHAEMALQESEKQYQQLVDSISEILFHVDVNGTILYINPAWERLTGFEVVETIGKRFVDYFHSEDRLDFAMMADSYSQNDKDASNQEIRLRIHNGSYRWVGLHMNAIRSADGMFQGINGTLIDINARKEHEQQVASLEAKRQTVEILNNLLTYISHDLRTPLSIITTNLYLLERKAQIPQNSNQFTTIAEQIDRITHVLDNMKILAELETLSPNDFNAVVDMNHIVEYVAWGAKRALETEGPTIHLVLSNTPVYIRGQQNWLSELVQNLLNNAIYFTPVDKNITLKTYDHFDKLIVEVIDEGIGLDDDDIRQIFDHFYRTDKSRSMKSGGSGLGLSIVKKIADLHKATIEVESEKDQGSVFRICFPTMSEVSDD